MKTKLKVCYGLTISLIILPIMTLLAIVGWIAGIIWMGLRAGVALAEMTPDHAKKYLQTK